MSSTESGGEGGTCPQPHTGVVRSRACAPADVMVMEVDEGTGECQRMVMVLASTATAAHSMMYSMLGMSTSCIAPDGVARAKGGDDTPTRTVIMAAEVVGEPVAATRQMVEMSGARHENTNTHAQSMLLHVEIASDGSARAKHSESTTSVYMMHTSLEVASDEEAPVRKHGEAKPVCAKQQRG